MLGNAYWTSCRSVVLLGCFLAAVFCRTSAAGLTYVSQDRTVRAATPAFDGDGGPDNRQSAPGFGPFDGSVTSHYTNPANEPIDAAASQRSELRPDGVFASGAFLGASPLSDAIYRTSLDVTFDVGERSAYRLDSDIFFSRFEVTTILLDVALRRIELTRLDVPASLVSVRQNDAELGATGASTPFSTAGWLDAGRYRLAFEIQYQDPGVTAGIHEGTYDLSFRVGDGGTPPPTAVPLPPAAWSGLIVLGGMVAHRLRQARRARPAN